MSEPTKFFKIIEPLQADLIALDSLLHMIIEGEKDNPLGEFFKEAYDLSTESPEFALYFWQLVAVGMLKQVKDAENYAMMVTQMAQAALESVGMENPIEAQESNG
jgi:hypothetical protein